MPLADALGWCAAALMLATFSCRNPLWMRPLAVCTNLAFIGYACSAALPPVLALHASLLPINLLRWWQGARDLNASRIRPAAPVLALQVARSMGHLALERSCPRVRWRQTQPLASSSRCLQERGVQVHQQSQRGP